MGIANFLTPAGIMIFGFAINQLGFYVILRQPKWIDWLPSDLVGLGLEFGGGLALIVGFMMFISNTLSESRAIGRPATRRGSRISRLKDRMAGSPIRCNFCGAKMSEGALFCPVCQKSQR